MAGSKAYRFYSLHTAAVSRRLIIFKLLTSGTCCTGGKPDGPARGSVLCGDGSRLCGRFNGSTLDAPPPVLLLRLMSDGPLCTEIGLREPRVSSRLAASSESLLGRSRASGPGHGLPGAVGDGGHSVMSTASVGSLEAL